MGKLAHLWSFVYENFCSNFTIKKKFKNKVWDEDIGDGGGGGALSQDGFGAS